MLDGPVRARLSPALNAAAEGLTRLGVRPTTLTLCGLAAGIAACVEAARASWWLALALWLVNRALDGLDGPVARQFGASEFGGLLDFTSDFVVYGGFVLGVAIARPEARVACAALLVAYLVNNVALLSFSSLVERYDIRVGDERTLRLTPGLAEGTETIAVYCLFCLLPGAAAELAWAFCALVSLTAVQRVVEARRVLSGRVPSPAGD